jgi:hypothetical protein
MPMIATGKLSDSLTKDSRRSNVNNFDAREIVKKCRRLGTGNISRKE